MIRDGGLNFVEVIKGKAVPVNDSSCPETGLKKLRTTVCASPLRGKEI